MGSETFLLYKVTYKSSYHDLTSGNLLDGWKSSHLLSSLLQHLSGFVHMLILHAVIQYKVVQPKDQTKVKDVPLHNQHYIADNSDLHKRLNIQLTGHR